MSPLGVLWHFDSDNSRYHSQVEGLGRYWYWYWYWYEPIGYCPPH